MSRAQLRELVVLFVVGSALTLAVFFLALLLLPFERLPPFFPTISRGFLESYLVICLYFAGFILE
jgi:hypothetical protein